MKRAGCVLDVIQINHPCDEQDAENRWVVVLEELDDEVIDELAGQLGDDIRFGEQLRAGEVGLDIRAEVVQRLDGAAGFDDERGELLDGLYVVVGRVRAAQCGEEVRDGINRRRQLLNASTSLGGA